MKKRTVKSNKTLTALLLAGGCGIALASVGCGTEDSTSGDGDDKGADDEPGPAYLLAQSIADGDNSEVLISILANVDEQVVDISQGLAVPGSARGVFSELGYVFVPNNEDFTITRYEVSEDLELHSPAVVSFAGVGLTRLRDTFVFSAERAYSTNDDGLLIVWDPTEMKILETVELDDLDQGDFLASLQPIGRDTTAGLLELAKKTGYLNYPVSWTRWEDASALPQMGVLSISTTDASDRTFVTTDCSSVATWGISGRDNHLYVLGTPAWGPYLAHSPSELPASAFARFDTETREFDDSFCESIASTANGGEGGIALQYAPGKFLLRTIDSEVIASSTVDGYWSEVEFACSFYDGDIDEAGNISLTETPEMGVDGGCFGGVFGVDAEPYFNIPSEGFASGALARWTGASMEVVIGLDGYPLTFERIR